MTASSFPFFVRRNSSKIPTAFFVNRTVRTNRVRWRWFYIIAIFLCSMLTATHCTIDIARHMRLVVLQSDCFVPWMSSHLSCQRCMMCLMQNTCLDRSQYEITKYIVSGELFHKALTILDGDVSFRVTCCSSILLSCTSLTVEGFEYSWCWWIVLFCGVLIDLWLYPSHHCAVFCFCYLLAHLEQNSVTM